MPRGFSQAQKVGQFSGRRDFQPRPKGVLFFSLKAGQEAVVRFTQPHNDIEWARKWRLAPNRDHQFGELVNAVDQHEDGTPDPGYQAGLRSSFKAYVTLIWRNAPTYQKKPDGTLVRDSNNAKVLTGYADQMALWECSYAVYELLAEIEANYKGLMSRDFKVKRIGGGTDTKYNIVPAEIDGGPKPASPEDQQLASTSRIDVKGFVKIPTYDELFEYINGAPPEKAQSFTQQVQSNDNAADGDDGPNPFLAA